MNTRGCSPRSIWASRACRTASSWVRCTRGWKIARATSASSPPISRRARAVAPGCWCRGGIAPNRAGWAKPFAGKLSSPREVAAASARDRGGARRGRQICMQILHTGRYAYHPFPVAPTCAARAHQPFQAARAVVRWRARPDRRLRQLRAARAGGQLRRRRDHGFGGLLHQRVPGAAHQPAHRRVGRLAREPRAARARDRARRRARPSGRDFIIIFRISGLDLVEGGGTGAEVEWLASQMEGAGATHAQHRHRLARSARSDHRRHRAARRVRLGVGAHQGGDAPAGDRHQPLQCTRWRGGAARERRRRTWCRWRGRCSPIRTCRARRAEGREDEINTCIACNQGCLDRVFENKRATCLVNPLRGVRDGAASSSPRANTEAHRRGRRGARGTRLRHHARGARPSRDAVRARARDRRPVPLRARGARARRTSTTRCATSRGASSSRGVDAGAEHRGRCGAASRTADSMTSSSRVASRRACRPSRASTIRR